MKTRTLLVLATLTLAACDEPKREAADAPKTAPATTAQAENKAKEPAAATAAAGSAAPAQPATSAAQAAPPADDELAVKGDYEDEAKKTITASNYKAELDAIDAELK